MAGFYVPSRNSTHSISALEVHICFCDVPCSIDIPVSCTHIAAFNSIQFNSIHTIRHHARAASHAHPVSNGVSPLASYKPWSRFREFPAHVSPRLLDTPLRSVEVHSSRAGRALERIRTLTSIGSRCTRACGACVDEIRRAVVSLRVGYEDV